MSIDVKPSPIFIGKGVKTDHYVYLYMLKEPLILWINTTLKQTSIVYWSYHLSVTSWKTKFEHYKDKMSPSTIRALYYQVTDRLRSIVEAKLGCICINILFFVRLSE